LAAAGQFDARRDQSVRPYHHYSALDRLIQLSKSTAPTFLSAGSREFQLPFSFGRFGHLLAEVSAKVDYPSHIATAMSNKQALFRRRLPPNQKSQIKNLKSHLRF
jgi:hypothetical protein